VQEVTLFLQPVISQMTIVRSVEEVTSVKFRATNFADTTYEAVSRETMIFL